MLDHFDKPDGKPRDDDLNLLAWLCTLAPDALPHFGTPLRFAETAVSKSKEWQTIDTLGAVLYRAGRYEEAAARLDEAIQAQGKGGAVGTWLFQAMARQRLGQQEEARRCLKTALAGFEEALPQDAARWTTRLELQTLRREAEDLLAAPRR